MNEVTMNIQEYQHEVVVPSSGLPFKLFAFEGKEGNYIRDKHWHRSVEIFAVWKGSLEFILGDKKYPLSAGEFIIVNSNEIHAISAPVPNQTVVLQIPQHLFADYFTDENFIWFSHSKKDVDDRMSVLLHEMFLLYQKKEDGCNFQVLSLFYELMYLMVTRYRKLSVHEELLKNSKQLNKLSSIIRYMKEHYSEELSLESLAAQFNYSTAYLSKMFTKYAGINYKDYLLGIRLDHAMQDLENGEKQIADIALNHGFPNSKAFSNAFRSKYGLLPSEYLKNKKDKNLT